VRKRTETIQPFSCKAPFSHGHAATVQPFNILARVQALPHVLAASLHCAHAGHPVMPTAYARSRVEKGNTQKACVLLFLTWVWYGFQPFQGHSKQTKTNWIRSVQALPHVLAASLHCTHAGHPVVQPTTYASTRKIQKRRWSARNRRRRPSTDTIVAP